MPRYRNIQNSFIGGDITPKAHGRSNLREFSEGCEEIRNMIVQKQGGATRRGGTILFSDDIVAPEGTSVKLLEFVFSVDEVYIIALYSNVSGEARARIFDLDGDEVQTLDLEEIRVTIQETGSFPPGPSLPFESSSAPYTNLEIPDVEAYQSGDRLYLIHPNHVPIFIARLSDDTFNVFPYWARLPLGEPIIFTDSIAPDIKANYVISTISPITDIAKDKLSDKNHCFLDENIDDNVFLKVSSANLLDTPDLEAEDRGGSAIDFFEASHVGAFFRLVHGATVGLAVVTSFDSASKVQVLVLQEFGATTATDQWAEGAFSNVKGFPRAASFFQSRLYFGGTSTEPNTIWATDFANIDNHNHLIDTQNEDAFKFPIASTRSNQIQWIHPRKNLTLGSAGREYVIEGSDPNQIVGGQNIKVSPETSIGSSRVKPAQINDSLIFVQRDRRKLFSLDFNFQQNAFEAEEVTTLNEHFLPRSNEDFDGDAPTPILNRIKQIAVQENDSIIWYLDLNGALLGITKDDILNIQAGHYHTLGGKGLNDIARIESIAVAPSKDGDFDQVYLSVIREVNGSTVRYIEKMSAPFEGVSLKRDDPSAFAIENVPVYVDAAKRQTNASAIDEWDLDTFFDTWENEVVSIFGDGHFLGTYDLSEESGTIKLPIAVKEIVVGFPYTSKLKTLPIDVGSAIGESAQGAIQKIDHLTFRFHRTIGGKFGIEDGSLDTLLFRPTSLAMDKPIPAFTGDKNVSVPASFSRRGQGIYQTDLPLPATVTAIITRGVTYD